MEYKLFDIDIDSRMLQNDSLGIDASAWLEISRDFFLSLETFYA